MAFRTRHRKSSAESPDVVEHHLLELGVEADVAGEVARVEQRRQDLHVARREARALARVPHRMPDHEARVPERVEAHLGDGLDVGVHLPRVEEEQVDVGAGIQLAATVAAEADRRAALVDARVAGEEIRRRRGEDERQQPVDGVRVGGDHREPALPGVVPRRDLVPHARHVLARRPADGGDLPLGLGERRHAGERLEHGRPRENHPVRTIACARPALQRGRAPGFGTA